MIWPARRVPNAEVVAVAARDGVRAADYAKQHGIPHAYGSYAELLADPAVDAVYVGLPNGLHGEWAMQALAAGKHVLCEKPFTANAEEAREVQALARRRGLLCREAFHYVEHPLMAHLGQLLGKGLPAGKGGSNGQAALKAAGEAAAAGPLGALTGVHVAVLIPKWVFGGANIRFQETLAGGAMMDAGCYCLHAMRSLLGGAGLEVQSATATMSPNSSVVDGAMRGSLAWRGRPGLRGTFSASLQHEGPWPVSRIEVTGDRGQLSVDNFIMPIFGNTVTLTTTSPDGGKRKTTTARVYGSGESTYYYQLSRFADDVVAVKEAAARHGDAKGGPAKLDSAVTALLDADAEDSIANMALLDAVYGKAGLAPRLTSAAAIAASKQQLQQQQQPIAREQGQAAA